MMKCFLQTMWVVRICQLESEESVNMFCASFSCLPHLYTKLDILLLLLLLILCLNNFCVKEASVFINQCINNSNTGRSCGPLTFVLDTLEIAVQCDPGRQRKVLW